ncbi:MAG: hypothetical protein KF752_07180 [Pirellulaceae bacterium]|nr:hypothetical protein [Pirellulaceae bacterium]
MEQVNLAKLTCRFGSPLFVFSEDQLRRNIRQFQQSFSAHWPDGPVKIMPAAKANWLPAIQRIVALEGCGCDTYSEGELAVALRSGVDPQLISVNGCPKAKSHIQRTLEVGARLTIDSLEDVTLLLEILQQQPQLQARVGIRIRPTLDDFIEPSQFVAEGPLPTDIAALAYKGGLSLDEVLGYLPRIVQHSQIQITGFHQHHGRHHRLAQYWQSQMKSYARDVAKLCQAAGIPRPVELDIGGGFASPRDPFNAATDYHLPGLLKWFNRLSRWLHRLGPTMRYRWIARFLSGMVSSTNTQPVPTIDQYAQAAAGTLRDSLRRHGVDPTGIMLQVEPGRSLFGNCGVHLTTIQSIKHFQRPIVWKVAATDTTEFWFTGGRYEHHLHEHWVANNASTVKSDIVDIVGRSCYGDRLLPRVATAPLRTGDVIAILDTGAYQEVSASNFNAIPRPATVLVHGDQAEIIRRAESIDEVFARDLVPRRLNSEESR